VDDETISAITDELLQEHPTAVSDDERWEALNRILGLLPDVDEWATAESVPMVFAISSDTLFTVRVPGDESVSVDSRPLTGHELIVRVVYGAAREAEAQITVREATWSFCHVGEAEDASREEWQEITGRVQTNQRGDQRLDQREKFARAIASRAGWQAGPRTPE
jgi:hypothetical protein